MALCLAVAISCEATPPIDPVASACGKVTGLTFGFDTTEARASGSTDTLSAVLTSDAGDAVDQPVLWTSSDTSVVSMAAAVATFKRPGTATVRATGCGKSADVMIAVFEQFDVVDLSAVLALPDSMQVLDLNDSLHLVGDRRGSDGWRGFLWKNGVMIDLPCRPRSINAAGSIACVTSSSNPMAKFLAEPRPHLWENGQLTQLLPNGGSATISESPRISDGGSVSGLARDSGFYRWTAGAVTRCVCAAYGSGRPNAAGDLPIRTGDDLYPDAAVWFADGTVGARAGLGGRYSSFSAINDSGDVVGFAERRPLAFSVAIVARKANGYRPDSIPTGWMFSQAVDINNRGEVIVEGRDSNFASAWYLWRGGRLANVQRLIPSLWSEVALARIANVGVILAAARRSDSQVRVPVLLVPRG